ncbi:hypothetical protein BOX15_Mlig024524g2 [Macrostomum lignano]|uniref:Uncharacterized protein n=1 Tax=Macrostomum lignano TaxID=282301 RepID=A0A267E028_9PLAT|nr:hypothetical protein BOX15_Mlig024524g1 [Macrostomum lignano]PAA78047.1 hypothetical protein BOX15_Mlig024524g2 [Macrostomum lignano]
MSKLPLYGLLLLALVAATLAAPAYDDAESSDDEDTPDWLDDLIDKRGFGAAGRKGHFVSGPHRRCLHYKFGKHGLYCAKYSS